MEGPSIEIKTTQDAENEAGKMTQSGAMSMWKLQNLAVWHLSNNHLIDI